MISRIIRCDSVYGEAELGKVWGGSRFSLICWALNRGGVANPKMVGLLTSGGLQGDASCFTI